MANGIKHTLRFRTRMLLRNALVYGSLGMLTGASVCAIVLFIGRDSGIEKRIVPTEEQTLTVCPGGSIQLQTRVQGDVYRWQPADGLDNAQCASPVATPMRSTSYKANVYQKAKTIISTGERFRIMASDLNGSTKEKTLWRFAAEAPIGPCLIVLQSRTTEFLDKGMLQLRVNNKPIALYNVKSETGPLLETIWNNTSTSPFSVTLHLLDYDGTADVLECSRLEIHALDEYASVTEVRVDKNCKGCEVPVLPQVINTGAREVHLKWNETPKTSTMVRYKKVKDNNWQFVSVKGKTAQLTELALDADYVVQAAAICKHDTSKWSVSVMLRAADRQLSSSWVEAQR